MLKSLLQSQLVRLLPLSLVVGLCLAAPTYPARGDDNNQGNDNSQGNEDQGDHGRQGNWDQGDHGPAVPEPAAWLAMGAGLLVVGASLRNRAQPQG